LLSACFFGMIASMPLWLDAHDFPLVPIMNGFPILPVPWDKLFFGAMLLALLGAVFRYEASVKFFLAASLFAFCEDQNRGQPWFYLYWAMLLFTLLPAPAAIAAGRCALSAVYIWSGIQKCNARFFKIEPVWFVAPGANWHLPPFVMSLLHAAVACTPFLEMGIGLAVWSRRLRPLAIGATLLVHLGALLFLGPLGHDYNWVVWPWNLAMIGLVCALFAKGRLWETSVVPSVADEAQKDKSRKSQMAKPSGGARAAASSEIQFVKTFADLRRSRLGLVLVALFSLLPVLSYSGWWDSYFGFSLYAENSATANIFVTRAFADRLPANMKKQVSPFPQKYDPQFQGPCIFNYGGWCYEELHVPPIPEPRAYRRIFNALREYSQEPGDLRMIVGQRGGPVIFYEGESTQFLTPK